MQLFPSAGFGSAPQRVRPSDFVAQSTRAYAPSLHHSSTVPVQVPASEYPRQALGRTQLWPFAAFGSRPHAV